MSPEGDKQQIPDGARWLELIGYSHLEGQPTGFTIDGEPVLAEQFDKLCGEHARPIFAALENLDKNDPRYEQFIGVARKAFEGYFGPAPSQ